jgi:signal transduction histidine kinase
VALLMPIDTVAVATVVGFVSHSLVGILAGVGIPVLVQRANEHEELIRSRDRAQALLAEVEAGREAEERAVALRERGRIARDLHDVLAHTLAGLSVQLQGIRAVAAREQVPASVLEPLDRAADLARSGLDEARAAVGVLRDPVGLGIDAIGALVARHPGPPTFRVTGSGAVSAEAGHAVYRGVQEALTNAARYAPGAEVVVSLEWSASSLITRVRDTGLPQGRSPISDQGTGLGLAGMDERVRAAGGTLSAGAVGAGWQVQIVVPLA